MRIRKSEIALLAAIILLVTVFFPSCMTYTQEMAKQKIDAIPSIPEKPLAETKFDSDSLPEEPVETIPEKRPIITFSAALVPLPCRPTSSMLDVIIDAVCTTDVDIIGFTGDADTLAYMAENLCLPTYWTGSGQLVATRLPIDSLDTPLARVQISPDRSLSIGVVDVQSSNVFSSLSSLPPGSWEQVMDEAHDERMTALEPIFQYNGEDPILVLASLGEPSGNDWFETAEGHPYRIKLRWPLVETFEAYRFLDAWRISHYRAVEAPGHTWELHTPSMTYAERVDYLFNRGLLPTETRIIPIRLGDTKKLPYEQRAAVTGTFILP